MNRLIARSSCLVLVAIVGLWASPSSAEENDKLTLKVSTTTSVHAMENADFRELDESSDRAVIDSDDRRLFGYTDVWATLGYDVNDEVRFNLQTQYDVLWRDDQLRRSAGSTGGFNVYQLNVDYTPIDGRNLKTAFRAGRQRFRIGGAPRDYMLDGTLDAITMTLESRKIGRFRLLGIDFFGGNGLPQTGYFYYRDGRQTTYNLRGETNTLRTGLVYEFDDLVIKKLPIEARAYYFYATIGGGPIEESGADITYGGALGNYRDRDYQHMMGARMTYDDDVTKNFRLLAYGEFARSMGIDRKPVTDRDVDTTGHAYGGGVDAQLKLNAANRLELGVEWYHFDGSNFASDGLEFERGFVGFKGQRVGGNVVGRYLAWRPSSFVDASGVVFAPHDRARVTGTEFLHARLGGKFSKLYLSVGWWMFKDTSSTFLRLSDLDSAGFNFPFGHTDAEYRAQARLGKDVGQAIDGEIRVDLNQALTVFAEAGAFLPGDYYAIEVDRVAGDQRTSLGGDATFLVGRLGVEVNF
ncbi:MAG: hypothetical protein VX589_12195 [Myxococcota bacterium]|nr:hypothetical protein [Myxococcota bacterium]